MSNDNNIVNHLIEDTNNKDKQLSNANLIIKRYRAYSIVITILLFVSLVKIELAKLIAILVFLVIITLLYFAFKDTSI